jgi:regulator of sigma E protease
MVAFASFLMVFTIVVLVHELGHFLAARRAGVKVYEFSIGFPFSPKIITLFQHRETEFTLRLLPLGGFVSFSKDGDEESADLFRAPIRNRAMIMSAGSLFNIAFAFLVFIAVYAMGKNMPLLDAMIAGAKTVWSMITATFDLIIKAFSGRGSWDGLSGPVGIAAIAGQAASKGLLNLAYFTGMLSLSLGIMNLIPFPALDGGQLLMLLIEFFRGKAFTIRTHSVINAAGFLIFIALTLIVTYKDISRIFA